MSESFKAFLSSAALAISVFAFGRIIFGDNKKIKLIFKIMLMILLVLLYTLIYINFDGTIKTVLLCILFTLTFKYIFNVSIGKSLLSSILFIIILVIPDLITLGIALYIFNLAKEQIYETIAGGIISNFFVSVIMIIIIYLLRKPLKKIININLSSNKKIIGVSMLIMIATAIFFYNLIKTFKFNNDIAGFLIAIFALVGILFYVFKQKIENNTISEKYDELLDVMKNYENDIEEQRTLLHETKNELTTIGCKIKDDAPKEEILSYIDSIMGDKVSSNMSRLSKFKYLPSNGLKGFFYYKFNEAEKKGIHVSVNISKQIENSFLGNLDTKNFKDLVRIIGVYMDNAIEASSISKNKKLGIEIYLIKGSIEIIISNTYPNDEETEIEGYSTKGKNRGHGLLLVKRILSNNQIISSKNEVTNKLYIQKIKIKNDKNKRRSV